MASINPYLNFNGNTEEAFNFYRSVFGGEFAMVMRFKEAPGMQELSPADAEKIMHIALPIGKNNVLMATDALECMGHKLTDGNNYYISISAETEQNGRDLFNGLSEGGKIEMPYEKAFWGAHFGSFKDKYGVQWMVNYDEKYV